MRTRQSQLGAGLILLIGITAALAILTASLTMLLANQQKATAREKKSKTSMYYAEAALNSAVAALKGTTTWLTTAYTDSTAMNTNYSSLPASRPTVTYRVYDNAATITASTPAYDANGDTKVWVEVKTTYAGRTSRIRQLVASVTQSVVSRFPKAALFSGGAGSDDNIYMNSSSDAYMATFSSWPATNANGTSYPGGAPYITSLMAEGNITSTGSANLALGSGIQSIGVQSNGTISIPGRSPLNSQHGGVPDLNSYFSPSDQLQLQQQSRDCLDPEVLAVFTTAKVDQRPGTVTSTTFPDEASLRVTPGNLYGTYVTGTKTFTANTNLAYSGNLTLGTSGTTYNFQQLTVTGDLTISSTAVVTGTLRVTGRLIVNGSSPGGTGFGDAYVIGAITISGSGTRAFQDLWTDNNLTITGTGAVTCTSLHVGGALSIGNTGVTNSFGSTWVVGNMSTTSTATSSNNFLALWVDGTLTLNGTTTTYTKALRVTGDFTISGPTSVNKFGPIYAAGNVNWGGAASVQTLDYTNSDPMQDPQPMWVGGVYTRNGGPFNDIYGNSFVVFRVNVTSSTGHSTIMCPLLATTEMITTSGNVDFGTMVTDVNHPAPRPMTLYMVCDNDGYYTQTANWGSTGQFTGLIVLMEAGIDVTTGNVSAPAIVGSILSIGGDAGVTLEGNAQVAYCQDVIDAVSGTLVTTSTTTQVVPGSWQELSPTDP
jgi:hypothetical protein